MARGDTLKLKPKVSEILADFDDKTYEIFWDFSTPLASKQEEAIRIIGLEDGSLKSFDVRASLEENSATLVLTNTTFNDSGIYHLRTMKSLSAKAIHKDFHVIIEGICMYSTFRKFSISNYCIMLSLYYNFIYIG